MGSKFIILATNYGVVPGIGVRRGYFTGTYFVLFRNPKASIEDEGRKYESSINGL